MLELQRSAISRVAVAMGSMNLSQLSAVFPCFLFSNTHARAHARTRAQYFCGDLCQKRERRVRLIEVLCLPEGLTFRMNDSGDISSFGIRPMVVVLLTLGERTREIVEKLWMSRQTNGKQR
jgi:hypothetical protein